MNSGQFLKQVEIYRTEVIVPALPEPLRDCYLDPRRKWANNEHHKYFKKRLDEFSPTDPDVAFDYYAGRYLSSLTKDGHILIKLREIDQIGWTWSWVFSMALFGRDPHVVFPFGDLAYENMARAAKTLPMYGTKKKTPPPPRRVIKSLQVWWLEQGGKQQAPKFSEWIA